MDLIRTMFKARSSTSPSKEGSEAGSPTKRKHEQSPTRNNNQSQQSNGVTSSGKNVKKAKTDHEEGEQKFSFDEVKTMLDQLLVEMGGKAASVAAHAGLRQVDFDKIAAPGHSVQACKELVIKLVNLTRRVRNTQEVITDIIENLNKRVYTQAIMQATLDVQPPKKPPSAYLLYHKERHATLRETMTQVKDIAKIVSEEWKNMSERQRLPYFKKHNELLKQYKRDFKRCGLVADEKPKRAMTAKSLYAQSKLDELAAVQDLGGEELSRHKKRLREEFDSLDKDAKAHWKKQCKIEQERYKLEQEKYMAANPHLNHHVPERAKQSRAATIQKPQPPKSALKYFLAKKIPEGLEGQEYDETKEKLKEKFARLSDKKLLKWVKKAVKDKERYDSEVEEFKQNHPEVPIAKVKATISKEQKKLYETMIENKPVPPPNNAYLYYCGKALGESNYEEGQEPTQRMQACSVAWSALSEKEKLEIEREHLAVIKTFLEEISEWLDKQTEERRSQVYRDEPRCRLDFWKKRVAKMERNLAKKDQ